jgi:hypothetical protein
LEPEDTNVAYEHGLPLPPSGASETVFRVTAYANPLAGLGFFDYYESVYAPGDEDGQLAKHRFEAAVKALLEGDSA